MRRISVSFVVLLLTLAGCKEEAPVVETPLPSVKVVTVQGQKSHQTRRFSGQLEALARAELSFGIAGRISELYVTEGNPVSANQLIAKLDPQNYQLAFNSALARLDAAESSLNDAKSEYRRQQELYRRQLVATASVDKAKAALESAESQRGVAQNDVDRAKEDLLKTQLHAPMAGTVSEKFVDRFAEISPSSPIVALETSNSFKVSVLVPESLIRHVHYQQAVQVRISSQEGELFDGFVSDIAAKAETGNAFEVSVQLASSQRPIRPGMTAEVVFHFGEQEQTPVFLLPISAMATQNTSGDLQPDDRRMPIYRVNPTTSSVELLRVKARDAAGNDIEVIEGLQDGDQVVVAGVAFLHDGMKVRIWQQP